MTPIANIRDRWLRRLADATASLCADELVKDEAVAACVMLIGVEDGHMLYSYRSKECISRVEAAAALRRVADMIEGKKEAK